MTKSDKDKKHTFSEVAKEAGEDVSPMPQRDSTQTTPISTPFPARLGDRVNATSQDLRFGDFEDLDFHRSPIKDWAEYKSPEESRPTRGKRSRSEAGLKTPEGRFTEGAWPQLENRNARVGDSGVQPLTPKLVPRFLVVESDTPGHPLTKCNIFAINTWFKGVSSSLMGRVSKAGTGFLVDCPSERVSKLLLQRNGTTFISLKVKVTAHRSLNYSKGVIWCPDLEGIEEEEILDNLRSEGVLRVERCHKKRGGIKVPTHTLFLTFDNPTLPESIVISCYLKVKVSLFVPRPLQCYNCFGFGHPSAKCKKDNPICGRCGHKAHEGACSQAAFCTNCKGNHAPTSRQCPKYKKEALIKKIMVQKRIPFRAARLEAEQEIEGSVPHIGRSFANAAASATGMQTSNNNNTAPVKTRQQKQSQNGTVIPENIRAEALAWAIDLRENLRSRSQKSTNATPTAPGSNGAKQTPQSKNKKGGRANKSQAKPGKTTAPAPQAAVDKQAPKPASKPAAKAGPNLAAASAPQAAAAKQAPKPNKQPATKPGDKKDPAPAPQAAGSKEKTRSAEQAPVPTTSKAKPGDEPAPASETPLPSSDAETEMEVTSESAPQATEVKQDTQPVTAGKSNKGESSGSPATSPSSLKEGHSFAAAAM